MQYQDSQYRYIAFAVPCKFTPVAPRLGLRRQFPNVKSRTANLRCTAAGSSISQTSSTSGLTDLNAARGPNVARFARRLAADWHNPVQSQENPQFWAHTHLTFRPLPNSFLGGYAFYTESAYDYNLARPYKTAVTLIVDTANSEKNTNVFEVKSFKLESPEKFWMGSHKPELLDSLTRDMLVPISEQCNIVVVWVEEEDKYIGISRPGKGCVIRRGGTEAPTYFDSRVVLKRDTYTTLDVGRDVETDERIWGGAFGPFEMVPKQRFDHLISDDFP
jgi:hypothetical protein